MCCEKNGPFSHQSKTKLANPRPSGLLRALKMLVGAVTLWEGTYFPKLRGFPVLKNLSGPLWGRASLLWPFISWTWKTTAQGGRVSCPGRVTVLGQSPSASRLAGQTPGIEVPLNSLS